MKVGSKKVKSMLNRERIKAKRARYKSKSDVSGDGEKKYNFRAKIWTEKKKHVGR